MLTLIRFRYLLGLSWRRLARLVTPIELAPMSWLCPACFDVANLGPCVVLRTVNLELIIIVNLHLEIGVGLPPSMLVFGVRRWAPCL